MCHCQNFVAKFSLRKFGNADIPVDDWIFRFEGAYGRLLPNPNERKTMQPRLEIPSNAFRHLGRKYFGTFAAFLSLSGISYLRMLLLAFFTVVPNHLWVKLATSIFFDLLLYEIQEMELF